MKKLFCVASILLAITFVVVNAQSPRVRQKIDDMAQPEPSPTPEVVVGILPVASPTAMPSPTPSATPEIVAADDGIPFFFPSDRLPLPPFDVVCDPTQGPCMKVVRTSNVTQASCWEVWSPPKRLPNWTIVPGNPLGSICVNAQTNSTAPNGLTIAGQSVSVTSNTNMTFGIPIGATIGFGDTGISGALPGSSDRPQYIFQADLTPFRKINAKFNGGLYIQFRQQLPSGATHPPARDCTKSEDLGLRVLDVAGEKEWICLGEKGWRWHQLSP